MIARAEDMTMMCGDCLELSSGIGDGSVDCVIADIPSGSTRRECDRQIPFGEMWRMLKRVCSPHAPIVLFASLPFSSGLIESNRRGFRYEMIWKKNVPTGMGSAGFRPMKYHEGILVFNADSKSSYNPIMMPRSGAGKGCYRNSPAKRKYDPDFVQPGTVLEFDVVPNRGRRLHPSEKPLPLMDYLVRTYSNPGDTVMDFCFGSGTTAEACLMNGRKFVGMELERGFYDAAMDRIARRLF